MSDSYEQEFIKAAQGIRSVRARRKLAPFWPTFKENFRPGKSLMVVGRAPNGFGPGFELQALQVPEQLLAIVRGARAQAEGESSLSWMSTPYKHGGTTSTRSPFWRVTREFAAIHGLIDGDQWWSGIGWSNLSKFAPEHRGNPSWGLWLKHQEVAVSLITIEVQEANPSVVLVLAAPDWDQSLRKSLADGRQVTGNNTVEFTARTGETTWLFARRPEGRPEAPFVADLSHALESARQ